jgi:hypothetical protein
MNGPVVAAGRAVLESGDITPVLKWIKADYEQELRSAFDQAVAVRKQSAAAKDLADKYFLETLVRLHRAGEGEPFTGLKPAGEGVTPAVAAADAALENGQIDALVKSLADDVGKGVRQRFERVQQAKRHAEHNVEAGREFVAAYVEFVHYVERIESDAAGGVSEGHAASAEHSH